MTKCKQIIRNTSGAPEQDLRTYNAGMAANIVKSSWSSPSLSHHELVQSLLVLPGSIWINFNSLYKQPRLWKHPQMLKRHGHQKALIKPWNTWHERVKTTISTIVLYCYYVLLALHGKINILHRTSLDQELESNYIELQDTENYVYTGRQIKNIEHLRLSFT